MNGIGKTLAGYYKQKGDNGIGISLTEYYKYKINSGGGHVDENGMILDDWDTIISLVKSGNSGYEIGNYKPLDLGTEGIVNMEIVAFNADELADGTGYAPTTWISKELLNTSYRMNPARSGSSGAYDEGTGTIGGWELCEMRTYLKNTIKPLIPSAVRSAIKDVTKYTRIYNTAGSVVNDVSSTEDVWLPSKREMFDGTSSSYETKGPRYSEAFPDNASRVKSKVGTSSALWWWLRSASHATNFSCVNTNGSGDTNTASNSGAVVLGFCI